VKTRVAAALALVLGLVLVTVLAACSGSQQGRGEAGAASTTSVSATPSQPTEPPVRAVFLGDSYTLGTGTTGAGYVTAVARLMGWTGLLAAQGGTGYVSSFVDPPSTPYGTRVPQVVGDRPDIVVVQGSTNDIGQPVESIGAAARQVYADLRTGLPGARIVVLGPLSPPGVDATAAAAVRDAVRGAAEDAGLPFVDPIAGGWLTPPDGLFYDPIHPNVTGYAQFSDDLVAALQRLGF
jgi:acyl-CoA thioesterase-1